MKLQPLAQGVAALRNSYTLNKADFISGLKLNGRPLTLNGRFITLTKAP